MLTSRPTKLGAGIVLAGDPADFEQLHEVIHELASESGPLAAGQDEFVLGLAYECRKAYEGNRPRFGGEDQTVADYHAIQVLWPILLVQVGMLRSSCAYVPTKRRVQANLYALEACIEEALRAADPVVASLSMRWLSRFYPLPDKYLLEFISLQAKDYVFGAKPGKQRFQRLPVIMERLDSLSLAYREFQDEVGNAAAKAGARPQDMQDWSAWPDFKW